MFSSPRWQLFNLILSVVSLALTILIVHNARHYRANAMDLCAWHARRMDGDDPASERATQLWRSIVACKAECPFCGQLHDGYWVSRNAWESQLNAFDKRTKGQ